MKCFNDDSNVLLEFQLRILLRRRAFIIKNKSSRQNEMISMMIPEFWCNELDFVFDFECKINYVVLRLQKQIIEIPPPLLRRYETLSLTKWNSTIFNGTE